VTPFKSPLLYQLSYESAVWPRAAKGGEAQKESRQKGKRTIRVKEGHQRQRHEARRS